MNLFTGWTASQIMTAYLFGAIAVSFVLLAIIYLYDKDDKKEHKNDGQKH